MKQKSVKKHWERRGFEIIFLLLGAVIFVVGVKASSGVRAQELISLDAGSAKIKEKPGISAKQIAEAVEKGGLAISGDFVLESNNLPENISEPPPVFESNDAIFESPEISSLNSDSLEYFESQGGLVAGAATQKDPEEPTIFKLAARFMDRVIFRNHTEFFKSPKFNDGIEVSGIPTFDKDTAGYAIIKKGNQDVIVIFDEKYDSPPVVTATLSLQQYKNPEVRAAAEDLLLISDVKFIVTNVTRKGFQIMMDRKADSDIPFSWHALAVNKPEIFKRGSKDVKNSGGNDFTSKDAEPNAGGSNGYSLDSFPGAVGESEMSSGSAASTNRNSSSLGKHDLIDSSPSSPADGALP